MRNPVFLRIKNEGATPVELVNFYTIVDPVYKLVQLILFLKNDVSNQKAIVFVLTGAIADYFTDVLRLFFGENDENKEYVNGHSSSIGNDNDDDDDDGEFNLKPAVNSDLIDRQLSSENQAQSFRLSSNGIKDSRSDEELSFNEEEEAKGRKDTGEEEEEGGGASSESIELSFNSKEIMNADDDGLELPMEEEDEHRRGAVSQDFSFDEEESEDKDESIKTLSENTPSVNNLSGE